jgi:hypothetical protein
VGSEHTAFQGQLKGWHSAGFKIYQYLLKTFPMPEHSTYLSLLHVINIPPGRPIISQASNRPWPATCGAAFWQRLTA